MNANQNKYQAQLVYDVIQEYLQANPENHIKHNFQTVNKWLLQRIIEDKKCLKDINESTAIDNKIIDKLHIMNHQETINQINVKDEKIL